MEILRNPEYVLLAVEGEEVLIDGRFFVVKITHEGGVKFLDSRSPGLQTSYVCTNIQRYEDVYWPVRRAHSEENLQRGFDEGSREEWKEAFSKGNFVLPKEKTADQFLFLKGVKV